MKLGIVITTNDPETVFNALRLAVFSAKEGDRVGVFLIGRGVETDRIEDEGFDIRGQAETFLGAGGTIMACGTCLRMRGSPGSKLCPMSTMKDLHLLIKDSDRIVTF